MQPPALGTVLQGMRKLLLTAGLVGLSAFAASADQVTDLRWKARVLVVSAPSPSHPSLIAQRRILAQDAPGLAERDIRLVEVVDQKNAELREKLKLPPGLYTVLLLGKDGGEKLRQDQPVELEALYGLIDAMPMRRREMRERR